MSRRAALLCMRAVSGSATPLSRSRGLVPESALFAPHRSLWPESMTLANYVRLLTKTSFITNMGHSLLVASGTVILGLALIGSIVFPGGPPWLAASSALAVIIFWIALPWWTRRTAHGWRIREEPPPHR